MNNIFENEILENDNGYDEFLSFSKSSQTETKSGNEPFKSVWEAVEQEELNNCKEEDELSV